MSFHIKISLGEGAFFGGEALVPPFETSYDVVMVQPARLLRLDLKTPVGLYLKKMVFQRHFLTNRGYRSKNSCNKYKIKAF